MANPQRKRRVIVWDNEVEECFSLWDGRSSAIYFECLRYRQQINPGQSFFLNAIDIEKLTCLSWYRQKRARKVLEGSGWIETRRTGNGIVFRLTDLAREATGHIPHRRDITQLYKKYRFSTGNA